MCDSYDKHLMAIERQNEIFDAAEIQAERRMAELRESWQKEPDCDYPLHESLEFEL